MTSLTSQLALGIACLCLQLLFYGIYMGSGYAESFDLHTCMANAFPAEPSLAQQPHFGCRVLQLKLLWWENEWTVIQSYNRVLCDDSTAMYTSVWRSQTDSYSTITCISISKAFTTQIVLVGDSQDMSENKGIMNLNLKD